MKQVLVAILCFTMASPPAWAGLPKTWKEIETNPKYVKLPTAEQIRKPMIAVDGSQRYYGFQVADKFLFLFDGNGYPIVTFDLTMDHMTLVEKALGAIGIGSWSPRKLFKKYKAAKENTSELLSDDPALREGLMPEGDSQDEADHAEIYDKLEEYENRTLPPTSDDDIATGLKEFAELEFTDEWIRKQGHLAALAAGQTKGFAPATFTFGDLRMKDKQLDKLHPAMDRFSKVFFDEGLRREDLQPFMRQFRMDWQADKQEFNLIWDTAKAPKRPKIPGWVVNYTNPLDILAYKYSLQNIERQVAGLEFILGRYANIIGVFVSRIINSTKSQLDSHENQLAAVLEAALRGDYKLDIPLTNLEQFVDVTTDLLYLNKMTDNEENVTDGPAKRAEILGKEAKYREDNLSWLAKKKYDVHVWSDQRFATVFKNGKKKGVASLAIKRAFITRQPSWHLYERGDWYKTFHRVAMEVFTEAFRIVLPTNQELSGWLSWKIGIGISVYVPSAIWDMLFRGRIFTEIAYEGHAITLVNEAIAGRMPTIPGYFPEELPRLQKYLHLQRVNPYEVSLRNEEKAIAHNLKQIIDFLGGGAALDFKYVKNRLDH